MSSVPPDSSLIDWESAWQYTTTWAGKPVPEVVLPGEVQARIATQIFADLPDCFPNCPGQAELFAHLRQQAVERALALTREERRRSGNPLLWHEGFGHSDQAWIDLELLQQTFPLNPAGQGEWLALSKRLRPTALHLVQAGGTLSLEDAEDIFQESLTAFFSCPPGRSSLIQQLAVFEQIPPTFSTVVKRRTADWLRHELAQKRDRRMQLSVDHKFDSDGAELQVTDSASFADWQAALHNPYQSTAFDKLMHESQRLLTPLQQRILTELYILESGSYMEIAQSHWFCQASGVHAGASAATKRRALDREHDAALALLKQAMA
jgi:hypothetical protein